MVSYSVLINAMNTFVFFRTSGKVNPFTLQFVDPRNEEKVELLFCMNSLSSKASNQKSRIAQLAD